MDDGRFDAMTRALGRGGSRRTLLKAVLGAGALAATGRVAFDDTDAARRPTPTPTTPKCPGTQIWQGSACICPTGTTCGSDCCTGGAQCCDGACCPVDHSCARGRCVPHTATPASAPSQTATNTPTSTPTNTPTNTPTSTPTSTPTNTPLPPHVEAAITPACFAQLFISHFPPNYLIRELRFVARNSSGTEFGLATYANVYSTDNDGNLSVTSSNAIVNSAVAIRATATLGPDLYTSSFVNKTCSVTNTPTATPSPSPESTATSTPTTTPVPSSTATPTSTPGCQQGADCGNTGDECSVYTCQAGVCVETPSEPHDCEYSDWGAWSGCSVSCGTGVVTRSRTIVAEASCGGDACDASTLVDQQSCTMQPCDCGPAPTCQPGDCGPMIDLCGHQTGFCVDTSVSCAPGQCGPLRDRCGTQVSMCIDTSRTCGPSDCGFIQDDCGNIVGDCLDGCN